MRNKKASVEYRPSGHHDSSHAEGNLDFLSNIHVDLLMGRVRFIHAFRLIDRQTSVEGNLRRSGDPYHAAKMGMYPVTMRARSKLILGKKDTT